MRYYQQVLRENEALLFACRMHWIVFLRSASLLLLALVLLLLNLSWPPGTISMVLLALFGLCLALAIIHAIGAAIRWQTTEIAVTDRRVIYKVGLISRRTIEMNVSKIETVDVLQGPLARMLDYGDVVIRGTGGTFEPLHWIGAPIKLRNAILVG